MANHHPTGYYLHKVNQFFMERASELSGSQIKLQYYLGRQLGRSEVLFIFFLIFNKF
jgi:hypothetical protein